MGADICIDDFCMELCGPGDENVCAPEDAPVATDEHGAPVLDEYGDPIARGADGWGQDTGATAGDVGGFAQDEAGATREIGGCHASGQTAADLLRRLTFRR